MNKIEITSLSHPGVEMFSTLTEAQLRNKLEPDKGIFIAESPKVIRVALTQGYEPVALLCENKHIEGDARDIISLCEEYARQRNAGEFPVYTGERDLLATLTGYTLTRGVLCAMRRPKDRRVEEVCGYRWGPYDPQFLRSPEPSGCESVDGFCFPGALDMAG